MGIAIRVEHLSKEYRLGVFNHGMLYKDMQSWFARKLGKADPHARIDADPYSNRVDRFWALRDLSLDVVEGDRVGIIGKNGAGKSTLLKILSRVTAPTEGTVKIRGRVSSLLEVGTGFNGELTGRENIFLNGAILGMKKREITRKLDEIIDFSEIEQYIDTPAKRYSSGMYVRLAFAVAAHLDSEILIADEVLAVGDASFQKKAIGKMNDLSAGQGRTVLFVSHNMGAVSQLCDTGILLAHGRIELHDKMQGVINKYFSKGSYLSVVDLTSIEPAISQYGISLVQARRKDNDRNDMAFLPIGKIGIIINFKNGGRDFEGVVAISVSNVDTGNVVFSINNNDRKQFFSAGKDYETLFEFENILLPGQYSVHFGINHRQNTVYWATEIFVFEVIDTVDLNPLRSGTVFVKQHMEVKEV